MSPKWSGQFNDGWYTAVGATVTSIGVESLTSPTSSAMNRTNESTHCRRPSAHDRTLPCSQSHAANRSSMLTDVSSVCAVV
ncbi:hypothetical protein CV102_18365 [Natronococcus pandeyae]|uniref:Uncharacterized protein n=1 Tax=Natronococcus pandeyae TaxID=2055836 RepID=A0A8J8TR16_9EURY|nr:hypothetical protein CV102_18365 [Natronococcus pandeyae]